MRLRHCTAYIVCLIKYKSLANEYNITCVLYNNRDAQEDSLYKYLRIQRSLKKNT